MASASFHLILLTASLTSAATTPGGSACRSRARPSSVVRVVALPHFHHNLQMVVSNAVVGPATTVHHEPLACASLCVAASSMACMY